MAIANPYTASKHCGEGGGLPVQNVAFQWADCTQGTVADLLHWADGRLLLVVFGDMDASDIRRVQALGASAPVVAIQVVAGNQAAAVRECVRDPQGHLRGACHVFGHTWALIRPDAYVAATGDAIDGSLVDAVSRALGTAEVDA
jgi:3-(3-hydroxy-phenyl)propionate hydroxylase